MVGERENRRLKNKTKACMIEDGDNLICIDPSLKFLNLLGKKYTMLILGVLGNKIEKKNFNGILNDIPFSSSTIISRRLKELTKFGLVVREVRKGRVTYRLSNLGIKVRESLLPLMRLRELQISV